MAREPYRLKGHGAKRLVAFGDLDGLIDSEILKDLRRVTGRPIYLQPCDFLVLAETEVLDQRIRSEAASGVDVPVDIACLTVLDNRRV